MNTSVSLCMVVLSTLPCFAGDELAEALVDDFSDAKFIGRQAERGAWQFQDGMASCVADPVLYKQFKNHGPILTTSRLRYRCGFDNS